MSASTLLRAARRSSGLSQGVLAARAQTSQPNVSTIEGGTRIPTVDTLERLLSRTGHRLIAIPGGRPDAVESADRIATSLRDMRRDSAFRAFLDYSDGLAATHGVNRVVLTAAEPFPTGSPAWDAAIAAVTEFRLNEESLPKPGWIGSSDRTLPHPATPHLGVYDIEPDVANVAPEFLRRNVLIERGTLASV
ncbi:MAG: helix-turn-helix transcriptional regulator [Cryobacterium sp.]